MITNCSIFILKSQIPRIIPLLIRLSEMQCQSGRSIAQPRFRLEFYSLNQILTWKILTISTQLWYFSSLQNLGLISDKQQKQQETARKNLAIKEVYQTRTNISWNSSNTTWNSFSILKQSQQVKIIGNRLYPRNQMSRRNRIGKWKLIHLEERKDLLKIHNCFKRTFQVNHLIIQNQTPLTLIWKGSWWNLGIIMIREEKQ